jgi:transcriptional regulator with XRE-family HTH domain
VQPNERLRHHRLQRGWTQENEAEELAALAPTLGEKHLPVTGRMVGKWERGEATPKGVYRRGLCLLFGATAEELGLYQPPEKGIEDMQRRAFLQGLGVLTGFAVASSFTYEPWERLSAALAQPRRLDDTAMSDLEAVTASLETQYATVAPVTLTGAVQGHLATITQLLDGRPPAQFQTRLYSLAGEVAGLAGWLSADMGQHDRALIYFDNGIKAAQEAKDQPLGAYLLGSVTTLPAFRSTARRRRCTCCARRPAASARATPRPAPGRGWPPWTPRPARCSGTQGRPGRAGPQRRRHRDG